MKTMWSQLLWGLLCVSVPVSAALKDTVHNLTATGPGTIKDTSVTQLCVFCHTPHNANPAGALWNRDLPGQTYTVYGSSTSAVTAMGRGQQPTGSSRMCLSCHDGTLALGTLRVQPRSGRVTLGPLSGKSSLGVDLSDDHPVSFQYDRELTLRRGDLVEPSAISHILPLDRDGQFQCTTCHDPHDDPYRKFLRLDDRGGALCTSCHVIPDWATSVHAVSPATPKQGVVSPWPEDTPFDSVADHACGNCHRSHSAPGPARLLSNADSSGVCLVCHDGSVAMHNVDAEFQKTSAHPISGVKSVHEPGEDPANMPRHVTCADCHNPHRTGSGSRSASGTPDRLRGLSGVSAAGDPVNEVTQEYEVCFKCHGDFDQDSFGIVRQDDVRNVRLAIASNNTSYHPVTAVGANPSVRGFESGYSASSVITCTDCHNSDEPATDGSRPRGPHGSRHAPLLSGEYRVDDPVPESAQSFELCYQCHNRSALIGDLSGGFSHATHVVDQQAACAVCHDAHGSRNNPSLINFMLIDRNGVPVVGPSSSGQLEYFPGGLDGGECYLQCHGVDHDPAPNPGQDPTGERPSSPRFPGQDPTGERPSSPRFPGQDPTGERPPSPRFPGQDPAAVPPGFRR